MPDPSQTDVPRGAGADPGVAERVDRTVRRSGWLARAVRSGLVAYGLAHLLFAWVTVRLVFLPASGAATGTGALNQVARDGLGRWSLGATSLAFAALVGWQLLAAAVGYREDRGTWRLVVRGAAVARAATYGYLSWASGRVALDGPRPGRSPRSLTARVLDLPVGPALLLAVAATVAGVGIGLVVFGWRTAFLDQLDREARRPGRRTPIVVVGRVGYVVKGAALVVVGVLLGWAALTHDPQKTGGLDQSLYLLLGGPAGRVAVVVVGVGIGCFGVYLLLRARYLDRARLTS